MWIEMEIRPLSKEDSPSLWKINEEGLPGTGKVSEDEIKSLLDYSELSNLYRLQYLHHYRQMKPKIPILMYSMIHQNIPIA